MVYILIFEVVIIFGIRVHVIILKIMVLEDNFQKYDLDDNLQTSFTCFKHNRNSIYYIWRMQQIDKYILKKKHQQK